MVMLASALSCAGGRPHGFSEGTSWAIPLLGGLNGGTPVTPVLINGKGPYLFWVDLDMGSSIDPALSKQLGLWELRSSGR